MRSLRSPLLIASALALAACVTINVYFPAAEAQQAAAEFVDKVIGDDQKQPEATPPKPPQAFNLPRFNPMSFLISDAQAQSVDISIRTPAIQAIQERMAARFQGSLQAQFDAGALGFGSDGLFVLRDPAKVALKDRVSVNQWVAEDNRDRKAVYREIAVANGHPEWEAQIRDTFAKQWIASAHKGWWYQDGSAWKQK
ncbi:MAG: DUF1318 domain-containing protein [Arenimonas sp.]